MALTIWGTLGGVTVLFFAALYLRSQKLLELRRVLPNRAAARYGIKGSGK
jgi:hypothetical protein